MARYTNLFKTESSIPTLRQSLISTLQSCDFNLIYETADYLVAKEKPGQVSISQLATIELLINPPTSQDNEVKISLVVKNEELPLRRNNHCQKVFETVNQAISTSTLWQPS